MATDVVIMGANGRMGSTLANLAMADPELNLVGLCERPGYTDGLERYSCSVSDNLEDLLPKVPGAVVINFTAPEPTVDMAKICAKTGNPGVIGTTGLSHEQLAELEECAKKTPLFFAPNMSIGVNVMLRILPELVQALGEKYDMEMVEIHHKMKKDSPSGTAIKLAEVMSEARGWNYDDVACTGRDGIIGERPQEEFGVMALRGGDVVGDHTAYFFGPGERIEFSHRAHSRENFANGALRAAKWMGDKEAGPLYSMQDVLF